MVPGEGLLVGSFARGLFLVQSECAESLYINSRPFRVNCGPVSLATYPLRLISVSVSQAFNHFQLSEFG